MRNITPVKANLVSGGSYVVKDKTIFLTYLAIQNTGTTPITLQLDSNDFGFVLGAGLIIDFENDIPKNKLTIKNNGSAAVDVIIWSE